MLCDHLEGWDREGGREMQEGGDKKGKKKWSALGRSISQQKEKLISFLLKAKTGSLGAYGAPI